MKLFQPQKDITTSHYTSSTKFKLYNLLIVLVCIIITVFLLNFAVLDKIENQFIDLRLQYGKNIRPDPRIVLIDIDEASIKRIGPWPWSREWHASLITTLSQAGSRITVLDIFFSEPTPLVDFFIVEATKMAKNVIYALAFEFEKTPIIHLYNKDRLKEIDSVLSQFSIPRSQIIGNISLVPKLGAPIYPLPNLYSVATDAGHTNVIEDKDGKIRRIPTIIECEGKFYPHLSLISAFRYIGVKRASIKIILGKYIEIKTIEGKIVKIPIDEAGFMWVNWVGKWGKDFEHFPFWKVITSYQKVIDKEEPLIPLEKFKEKICLVGLTALGLIDIKPVPIQTAYPMVGLHANVINTILQRKFIHTANLFLIFFFILFLGLFIGVFLPRLKPVGGSLFILAITIGYLSFCFFAFKFFGILFNIVYPLSTILLCYLGVTLHTEIASAVERARLYHLAIEDGLTKLYVVRHFKELLEKEISKTVRYKRPLSLIISDIDHFKHINDTYGHLAGDFILKEVANIFKASCRETDIIGRYGGEEFAILLPETTKEGAVEFAERLRKQVENFTFQYNETKLNVTVSFGITQFIEGDTPSEFIKRADEALYVAKETGRNKVCFN